MSRLVSMQKMYFVLIVLIARESYLEINSQTVSIGTQVCRRRYL